MSSPAKPIAGPGAPRRAKTKKVKAYIIIVTCFAVVFGAVAIVRWAPWQTVRPTQSVPYLGIYEPDAPQSYTDLNNFAQAIGRQPNLVTYYSHWGDQFQVGFAASAANHGALTLIQMIRRTSRWLTSLMAISTLTFAPMPQR